MQLYAPAKINLSLVIKARRADGFHEIETLMAPVSLSDRVTLRRIEGTEIRFSCDDPSLSSGDDNLVVRAARLFQETTKVHEGIEIVLEKKIPHGAGLGGGSSDAATTLLGLNEFFHSGLDRETLIGLAARIGSDVPFFMIGGAAICRGRGEIVEPAVLPGKLDLLLVKPDFGVPTPWAYSRWSESRELPGIDYNSQEFSGVRLVNALERPVFEKYVLLGYLKKWLRLQPEVGAALLSGSGSTLFAVLRPGANAEEFQAHLRRDVDESLWTLSCEAG